MWIVQSHGKIRTHHPTQLLREGALVAAKSLDWLRGEERDCVAQTDEALQSAGCRAEVAQPSPLQGSLKPAKNLIMSFPLPSMPGTSGAIEAEVPLQMRLNISKSNVFESNTFIYCILHRFFHRG